MDEDLESDPPVTDSHRLLHQHEVPGGRNREKLGQSLDEAEYERFDQGHGQRVEGEQETGIRRPKNRGTVPVIRDRANKILFKLHRFPTLDAPFLKDPGGFGEIPGVSQTP